MKHSILFTLFIAFSLIIYAQPSKRASCLNYLKYGELDKAKQACDECVEHDKTKTDARAWWYRGQVYQEILTSKNDKYKNLDKNAVYEAFDSYKKALLYNFVNQEYQSLEIFNKDKPQDLMKFFKLLNDPNTKYTSSELLVDIIKNRYPILANNLVNKGVSQYKEEDFSGAAKSFENSLFVSTMSGKIDTPIVYYAALASDKAKNYSAAKDYYNTLIKMKYGKDDKEKATMYYLLANVYKEEKDTANFIKTLDKGIEKYPKESILLSTKINWYIDQGKAQEAEDIVKKAVEADPNNKLLQFNLGTIYEGKGDRDNAIACYKKAIEIDPDYLLPNYNLGALYNNWAKDIFDEAQDLTGDKYDKKMEEYNNTLKMAKPYLEKAHELDPKDIATIQSLKIIYYKTKEMDKYKHSLEEIHELVPDDLTTIKSLMMLYKQDGETEKYDKMNKLLQEKTQ